MYKSRYSPKHIYVFMASNGNLKIGISSKPWKRLSRLQAQAGLKMDFVHFEDYVDQKQIYDIEQITHYLLAAKRLEGEWFNATPKEARDAIRHAASINQFCIDMKTPYVKMKKDPHFKYVVSALTKDDPPEGY